MLHLMDGSYVGSLLEFLSNCQLKLFHALRAKIESEIFEELVGTPECDFTNFFQVSSSRFTLFPFPVIVSASYSQFCQTVAEIRWKINPSISRIFWSGWFTLLFGKIRPELVSEKWCKFVFCGAYSKSFISKIKMCRSLTNIFLFNYKNSQDILYWVRSIKFLEYIFWETVSITVLKHCFNSKFII